jgi:hypothetical protein
MSKRIARAVSANDTQSEPCSNARTDGHMQSRTLLLPMPLAKVRELNGTSVGSPAWKAISRIAADATAFPHRDIHATFLLDCDWQANVDPTAHIAWLRKYWATLEPHTDGFYTNDVVDETQKQIDDNYLGNYPRLVALKNKYDPTNLFRLNANVKPTA